MNRSTEMLALKICRECFYTVFEEEIHQVIVENQLFKPGERIGIGASGGKRWVKQLIFDACWSLLIAEIESNCFNG